MVNVHGGEDTEDSDVRLEQVCAWAREEDEEEMDVHERERRTSIMCVVFPVVATTCRTRAN